MSQIYWRVCITVIMPPAMRTQPGYEGAVHSQTVISDWLDLCNGYQLLCGLREHFPITATGCLYDHQQKVVDGHEEHERRMAAMKADFAKYVKYLQDEKARIWDEAKQNARDFIRDFDVATYFALHVAGQGATR